VTGAASGIGLSVSALLADSGSYSVMATAMPGQPCAALENLERVEVLRVDLSGPESIEGLIASARLSGRLDGIVSCAGMAIPGPLEMVPPSQLALQYQVNAFAPVQIVRGLLPSLRAARGRVVVVGAGQARASLPCGGAYGSSKAALSALLDSLRAEVAAFGISVSVIEPGAVKTGILESSKDSWNTLSASTADMDDDVAEFYRSAVNKSLETSERAFETATAPESFAKTVVKVLESPRPRPRYLVGREAKVMGIVSALPDSLRAALMRRMM
jgi:NAD(P)-dependent dehydrogenase (short-subunit alcohol dehydrogenase family)